MRLDTVDRSSISRTLALLLDKGLVHTIDDGSGSAKFELCHCHSHRSLEQESSALTVFLATVICTRISIACVAARPYACLTKGFTYRSFPQATWPQRPTSSSPAFARSVQSSKVRDGLRRKMNKDAGGLCILPVNDWHRQEIGYASAIR